MVAVCENIIAGHITSNANMKHPDRKPGLFFSNGFIFFMTSVLTQFKYRTSTHELKFIVKSITKLLSLQLLYIRIITNFKLFINRGDLMKSKPVLSHAEKIVLNSIHHQLGSVFR